MKFGAGNEEEEADKKNTREKLDEMAKTGKIGSLFAKIDKGAAPTDAQKKPSEARQRAPKTTEQRQSSKTRLGSGRRRSGSASKRMIFSSANTPQRASQSGLDSEQVSKKPPLLAKPKLSANGK